VSVTTTIALVEQRPLVRVNELDPQTLFRWDGEVSADMSGGFLQGDCFAPVNMSVLWILVGGQITSSSTSDAFFTVLLDDVALFSHSVIGHIVNTNNRLESWRPPQLLINPQVPGTRAHMNIICDNVDGDDLQPECLAFGWDADVGRNLPQKFFWPGSLG